MRISLSTRAGRACVAATLVLSLGLAPSFAHIAAPLARPALGPAIFRFSQRAIQPLRLYPLRRQPVRPQPVYPLQLQPLQPFRLQPLWLERQRQGFEPTGRHGLGLLGRPDLGSHGAV